MTDINELDEIMSGAGDEPVLETEQTSEVARDDKGRFASKEQPDTEATVQEPEPQEEAEPTTEGKVPLAAVHEARQKEREAKQEAETLRQQIATLNGQMQVLMSQRQQTTTQPQQEAKAPDFWEDPNGFVTSALTPVQQQMQRQKEEFSQTLAIDKHGAEAVQGAYQAMGQAMQTGDPAAKAAYQAIMASPHPYGALVDWHKEQQTRQTVGNDPMAWFEAEMEKRLSDPATQAKILERIRGAAAANASQSQPQVNLPKSLNRLPGGGNSAENDMSDSALFSQALR